MRAGLRGRDPRRHEAAFGERALAGGMRRRPARCRLPSAGEGLPGQECGDSLVRPEYPVQEAEGRANQLASETRCPTQARLWLEWVKGCPTQARLWLEWVKGCPTQARLWLEWDKRYPLAARLPTAFAPKLVTSSSSFPKIRELSCAG